MSSDQLQYLSNTDGEVTAVVVPIEQWQEITSEIETQHLLKIETMKTRLLAARGRNGGASLEEAAMRLSLNETDE